MIPMKCSGAALPTLYLARARPHLTHSAICIGDVRLIVRANIFRKMSCER